MITKSIHGWRKTIAIFCIALVMATLPACANGAASGPVSTNASYSKNVLLLQKNTYFSASLTGEVTLDSAGRTTSTPMKLEVPAVPIEWMGRIFFGGLDSRGAGQIIADQIHGSLSEDGDWIESLTYSRQITRTATNTGTLFRVTMRNLPLAGDSATAGIFERTGTDIQKHVQKIEYIEGSVNNGKITSDVAYVSTDWKGERGVMPSLKLAFEKSSDLASVRQNRFLTVRLLASGSYDFAGTPLVFPAEFDLASIPLVWEGNDFTGSQKSGGQNQDIFDQAHGTISADGTRLTALSYSRRATSNIGVATVFLQRSSIYYQVTLKDVPLSKSAASAQARGFFQEGSELGQVVTGIEYTTEQLFGERVVPIGKLISVDWTNTSPGSKPVLTIAFDNVEPGPLPGVSGNDTAPAPRPSGGGMM